MLGRTVLSRTVHATRGLAIPLQPTYKTADLLRSKSTKSLSVNLLPLWRGQGKQGVRYAPGILLSKLRELSPSISNTNYITDSDLNKSRTTNEFVSALGDLSSEVDTGKDGEGGLVVNLGGDHAIPIMTIPVMLKRHPNLRVIWVDAHADINSPDSSPSGNVHGMPVWFLSEASKQGGMPLDRLVYVGVRDTDPAEVELMEKYGIKNYTKEDIDKRGLATVVMEIINRLELFDNPVHISFDIDALDPSLAPSTGTKVPEGLSVEDVVGVFSAIKKTGSLVSCDVVEFNPLIGTEADVERTVQSIETVLREIIK
eukprot:sb/3467044/